jgi:uncharacterized membrane protein
MTTGNFIPSGGLQAIGDEWPGYLGYVVSFAGALLSVLWRYALHARLVRPDAGDEEITLLTHRLTPGLAAYVVLIGVGLFFPIPAVIGYLGIALFFLIPAHTKAVAEERRGP